MVARAYHPKRHKEKKSSPVFSRALILVTLLLSIIGLFFVFEASVAESFATFGHQYYFVRQQAFGLALGLGAMLIGLLIPYKFWYKTAWLGYGFGLLLLILVFVPGIGMELNGASRWLSLGQFRLQPIELFKLILVLFFARWMSQSQKLLSFLVFTGVPVLLVLLQPDLGSVLVLLWIAFGLFFLAGGKLSSLLSVGSIGVILLVIVIVVSPYRLRRLNTFLNPEYDPLGASFHIRQITLALGSGGWFGQGLGNSRQKFAYIPEASSDSIFAIVAEEIGFAGSIVVVILFGLYFYFAYRLVTQVRPGSFAQLVGLGVLLWISGQMLLNLAAVVALVPLTGLPLPFFSFGSSSLVTVLLATGILARLPKETIA